VREIVKAKKVTGCGLLLQNLAVASIVLLLERDLRARQPRGIIHFQDLSVSFALVSDRVGT